MRILIVEDSYSLADTLQTALKMKTTLLMQFLMVQTAMNTVGQEYTILLFLTLCYLRWTVIRLLRN